jgi:hypothetical protein
MNISRPYWTLERAVFRLLSDSVGCAICWVTRLNIIAGISVVNVAPEKTAVVAHAINWWAAKMFPLAVIACAVILVVDAYRVYRVRANAAHPLALNTASGAC